MFNLLQIWMSKQDAYMQCSRKHMTEGSLLVLATEIISYVKPSYNMRKMLRPIDSELHLQKRCQSQQLKYP